MREIVRGAAWHLLNFQLDRQLKRDIPHSEIEGWKQQGLVFEPRLEDRILNHLRYKFFQRERGEQRWLYVFGSYTESLFTSEENEASVVNGVSLKGMELGIFNQITRMRENKDEQEDNSPVVVVDFGGLSGISMMRLATAMTDLVDDNKVLFIVTSIAYRPDVDGIRQTLEYGSQKTAFDIDRMPNRVHFVQADAEELLSTSFTVNDIRYPLAGNVDIVHEADALKHDHISDIDLPRIAKLLSGYGTFFMRTHYLDLDQYMLMALPDDPLDTAFKERRLSHLQGEANLERMGLPLMDLGNRKSPYRIYAMPNAPRL